MCFDLCDTLHSAIFQGLTEIAHELGTEGIYLLDFLTVESHCSHQDVGNSWERTVMRIVADIFVLAILMECITKQITCSYHLQESYILTA